MMIMITILFNFYLLVVKWIFSVNRNTLDITPICHLTLINQIDDSEINEIKPSGKTITFRKSYVKNTF